MSSVIVSYCCCFAFLSIRQSVSFLLNCEGENEKITFEAIDIHCSEQHQELANMALTCSVCINFDQSRSLIKRDERRIWPWFEQEIVNWYVFVVYYLRKGVVPSLPKRNLCFKFSLLCNIEHEIVCCRFLDYKGQWYCVERNLISCKDDLFDDVQLECECFLYSGCCGDLQLLRCVIELDISCCFIRDTDCSEWLTIREAILVAIALASCVWKSRK